MKRFIVYDEVCVCVIVLQTPVSASESRGGPQREHPTDVSTYTVTMKVCLFEFNLRNSVILLMQGYFGEHEHSGGCPISDPTGSTGGGGAARDSSRHHCTRLPTDSAR